MIWISSELYGKGIGYLITFNASQYTMVPPLAGSLVAVGCSVTV
jgi:hypothetical protein